MSEKITRRQFLKLAGTGLATAAVLTGCGPASRFVTRQPYTSMPEYTQVGKSTYYATTCRECAAACGIIMRTLEGRAIKAEGNPDHPVNRGKLCSRGLTSVQGLYNPDRIQGPRRRPARGQEQMEVIDWNAGIAAVQDALQKNAPGGVAFLLGTQSDHVFDLVSELAAAVGADAPLRYGAEAMLAGRATLREASTQAFKSASLPQFDLANADLVFAFGADFLGSWLSPVHFSRAYGAFRRSGRGRGRLVVFSPRQSVTAGAADEWVPVKPGSEAALAQAMSRLVAEARQMRGTFANLDVAAVAELAGISEEHMRQLATQFAASERPLAIVGGDALAHANGVAAAQSVLSLNAAVDNFGKPGGVFSIPAEDRISTITELKALVDRMNGGQVKTLFIHGVNPVFELPAGLGFAAALAKVPQVIAFSSFPDETALQADLILPDHTGLESFGYQNALTGTDRPLISALQPVVVPLYETRSTADVFLATARAIGGDLAGKLPYTDEVDFIQQKIVGLLGQGGSVDAGEIKSFWALWLQHGGWWKKDAGLEAFDRQAALDQAANIQQPPGADAGYDLQFITYQSLMGDGSGANRPWLQETPDPMTTVMWGSWVEIHPATAARLGVKDDDIVKITSPAGEVEAVVYLYPAIHPQVIAAPFGQGHTAYGRFAQGRGFNPAALLPLKATDAGDLAYADTWVKVTPTGRRHELARKESREGIYGEHPGIYGQPANKGEGEGNEAR